MVALKTFPEFLFDLSLLRAVYDSRTNLRHVPLSTPQGGLRFELF